MYKVLIVTLLLVLLYGFYEYKRTVKFIEIGVGIAEKANAYEQNGDGKKVLFLGDSSAVGTGASVPAESVAGYLGVEYPDVMIKNLAVNGYKTEDVLSLLGEKNLDEYSLVVLQIGGNDIVRLVDIEQVEENLVNILREISVVAPEVIVFHGGNVGTSKLFPWFVRPYYTYRTKKFRSMYLDVVQGFENVKYVDMFREFENDPFYLEPDKFYADDYFHPSSAGYKDWYDLMNSEISVL